MDLHSNLIPRTEGEGAGRGQRALVATGVLTGIAAATVAMRFGARLGLMKVAGREDWTILLSLVSLISRSSLLF